MTKDDRHSILAEATAELFDTVLRPGNPTGIGMKPEFLRFGEKVRTAYPTPDILRGDI